MTRKNDSRPWAFDSNPAWDNFKAECKAAGIKLQPVNSFYSDDEKGRTLTVQGHDCCVFRVFVGGDYGGLLFVMGHGELGFTPYLEMRDNSISGLVREICERTPAT